MVVMRRMSDVFGGRVVFFMKGGVFEMGGRDVVVFSGVGQ